MELNMPTRWPANFFINSSSRNAILKPIFPEKSCMASSKSFNKTSIWNLPSNWICRFSMSLFGKLLMLSALTSIPSGVCQSINEDTGTMLWILRPLETIVVLYLFTFSEILFILFSVYSFGFLIRAGGISSTLLTTATTGSSILFIAWYFFSTFFKSSMSCKILSSRVVAFKTKIATSGQKSTTWSINCFSAS